MTERRMVSALLVAALVVGSAIGCAEDFDREQAVSDVLAAGDGRIERPQAECYVDRVLDEIGPGPLRPGANVPPDQLGDLTRIRIDCIGLDSLGVFTPDPPLPTVPGPAPGVELPDEYGEDPTLDALWRRCEAGEGQACDELFDLAPIGSAYEDFAASCGGRTQEPVCAAVYPAPGVVVPPPDRPPPTPPPPSP